MVPSKFVHMNVTTEARDALRSVAFALTGRASRRVGLSDALIAACAVATEHLDAAAATLEPTEKGTDSE